MIFIEISLSSILVMESLVFCCKTAGFEVVPINKGVIEEQKVLLKIKQKHVHATNSVIGTTCHPVVLQQNINDSIIKMDDKDTLGYFTKYHVLSHSSQTITLDTFVSKYN